MNVNYDTAVKTVLEPLTNGAKALLRCYAREEKEEAETKSKCKKAFVWITGRSDSFHTPSFGQMLQAGWLRLVCAGTSVLRRVSA